MKNIFSNYNEADNLYVASYGIEDISENAHWGKGSRNAYIIHYVLEGAGYYNGAKVSEGQGFYIPKGVMHEYWSSVLKPWKYFWIILNGTDADSICRKYLMPQQNGVFEYNFKNELKNFADIFFAQYKTISAAKALGVFWNLVSNHENEEKISSNKYVTEAKKYMEQNFYRSISISEVSEVLHISDRYMYNLFIKYEGQSPKQFLNNLRIQKASLMLKGNTMSVTEIATSVGFDDVLAFSRFFKSKTRMSPTEYRKSKYTEKSAEN